MSRNADELSRRRFLRNAGLGAAALYAANSKFGPVLPFATANSRGSKDFRADVEINISARPAQVQILEGPETPVLQFRVEQVNGPAGTVIDPGDGLSGPQLRFHSGQKVRVNYHNDLTVDSILHWHGLHVPESADGHPRFAVEPGGSYVYEFQVLNRAGTYWFHSHTHQRTGEQVLRGLAGVLIVTDPAEQALGLPSGTRDITLVIQDRRFDRKNRLGYVHGMHERMLGFLGDRVLVNGHADYELKLEPQVYRFRLLNLSNSRIYKTGWSDGTPFTVIGTDGGLLEKPEQRPYLMLAPAERVDLWVDLSRRAAGERMEMRSLPFELSASMMGGPGRHGMRGGMGPARRGRMGGHGMMGVGSADSAALPHGGEYPLFGVGVGSGPRRAEKLPQKLSVIPRYRVTEATNADQAKTIRLAMRPHSPTLNGRSFEMTTASAFETVRLGSMVLLEFVNRDPMMHGMIMPHPMHVHGQQFQVVDREVQSGYLNEYRTVREGFVDSGWKDTVLVMPGEKVTILKRFDDYTGLFLYHCHNLEHEDLDMMRNFLVRR